MANNTFKFLEKYGFEVISIASEEERKNNSDYYSLMRDFINEIKAEVY